MDGFVFSTWWNPAGWVVARFGRVRARYGTLRDGTVYDGTVYSV